MGIGVIGKPAAQPSRHSEFVALTELSGTEVTTEQIERLARRYYWAGEFCRNRDVLEVACGSGQGVGYLTTLAKSVTAGDISDAVLEVGRKYYGNRVAFEVLDAQQLPFPPASFDVVILFEALYYIPDTDRFFAECHRVLRPRGQLLIATANKDLFDFTPSPHSHHYLGVVELEESLRRHGFGTEFLGDTPVGELSIRQRALRPVKAIVSKSGLMPRSMNGKKLLKRLVFGSLQRMPGEITEHTAPKIRPTPLPRGRADTTHKVIYCSATRHT